MRLQICLKRFIKGIGCLCMMTVFTVSLSGADWPMYKGNIYYTGNNDEIIVKNNSLKWMFMASNYVFNPVVSEGRVYFTDMDKVIYCLNAETGNPLWKWKMQAVSSHFAGNAGVAGKVKYPVIAGPTLFVSDATALYAINKYNGQILWARAGLQEANSNRAVIDGIYTDPMISGNQLVYGTRKNFIAREQKNGHVVWSNPAIESYSGFPAVYDGRVLSSMRDYKANTFSVLCLSAADGSILWRRQVENPLQLFSPVVNRGMVYMATGSTLYCLSLTDGSVIWTAAMSGPVTSQPSFTEQSLFLTVNNNSLVQISPENGRVVASMNFGGQSSPYFVIIRDQYYTAFQYPKTVGGRDITFTALKAYTFGNADPLWEFQPPFPGGSSQPCAENGVLFLPAGNYLYAIGTYYDKPITLGHDGTTLPQPSPTATPTVPPVAVNPDSWGDDPDLGSLPTKAPTPQPTPATATLPEPTPAPSIPDEPVNLASVPAGSSFVLKSVQFEFNQAYLLRESVSTLQNLAAELRKNPGRRLLIEGHTDNVGDKAYNQRLAERRAQSVMEFLVKQGISPGRLEARGYGMDKPKTDNTTEAGRAANRRTEFRVLE